MGFWTLKPSEKEFPGNQLPRKGSHRAGVYGAIICVDPHWSYHWSKTWESMIYLGTYMNKTLWSTSELGISKERRHARALVPTKKKGTVYLRWRWIATPHTVLSHPQEAQRTAQRFPGGHVRKHRGGDMSHEAATFPTRKRGGYHSPQWSPKMPLSFEAKHLPKKRVLNGAPG